MVANDMYYFVHDESFSRIFTTYDDENFKLQLIHFNKIMLFVYNILPNIANVILIIINKYKLQEIHYKSKPA